MAFCTDANEDHVPYQDGNIYTDWGSTTRRNIGNPTPAFNDWRIVNITSRAGEWTFRIDGEVFFTTGANAVGFTLRHA